MIPSKNVEIIASLESSLAFLGGGVIKTSLIQIMFPQRTVDASGPFVFSSL